MNLYRYINENMEAVGPASPEEMAAAGITDDTLVWREGMDDWLPASMVGDVATALHAPLPTPAPAMAAGFMDAESAASLTAEADEAPAPAYVHDDTTDMSLEQVQNILNEMEGTAVTPPSSMSAPEVAAAVAAPESMAMTTPPPPPPLRTTPPPPPQIHTL